MTSRQSMTGPEHYAEAELLMGKAKDAELGSEHERYYLAKGQVHATLALAAATAVGARMGYGLGNDAGQAWDAITNPAKRGGRS